MNSCYTILIVISLINCDVKIDPSTLLNKDKKRIILEINKIKFISNKEKAEIATKSLKKNLKRLLLSNKNTLLKKDERYSYSLNYLNKKLGTSNKELFIIAESLSKDENDKINVFKFGDIWFMGFESRRLDYERDKKNGNNPVEPLIKKGIYGKDKNKFSISI